MLLHLLGNKHYLLYLLHEFVFVCLYSTQQTIDERAMLLPNALRLQNSFLPQLANLRKFSPHNRLSSRSSKLPTSRRLAITFSHRDTMRPLHDCQSNNRQLVLAKDRGHRCIPKVYLYRIGNENSEKTQVGLVDISTALCDTDIRQIRSLVPFDALLRQKRYR